MCRVIHVFICSKKLTIDCPKCGDDISLDDCFKDKAAENELKTAIIRCINQDCPWEGPSKFYMVWLTVTDLDWMTLHGLNFWYSKYFTFQQEHIKSCKFTKIPCPNKQYGCPKLLLQSQWEEHLERDCRFIPVQCPWCSKKVHNKEVRLEALNVTVIPYNTLN